jgi:membrane associated rhomboid family serine protease
MQNQVRLRHCMLYDRIYMQSPSDLLRRSFCDQLIIILISCFVLQSISSLIFGSREVNHLFGFGFKNLSDGHIWTLFTYGLVHDGPLHLIVNLLGIHFIGRPVEDFIGRKKFKYFIVSSLFFGAISWFVFNSDDYQYLVGASAIVLACLCFFCILHPNQPITLLLFFIVPVNIKPKWVLLGTLVLEIYGFMTTEIGGNGGIAHSAHLGGMLCGAVTTFIIQRKFIFPYRFKFINTDHKQKGGSTLSRSSYISKKIRVNFIDNLSIKAETDRILDKINEKGFGSLTSLEKETLEKAKKLLDK